MDLEAKYAKVIRYVWNFSGNDQRQPILSWLDDKNIRGQIILDVGAGDAYYIDQLWPDQYDYIEPNIIFQQQIKKKLRYLKIPYSQIKSIFCLTADDVKCYDVILLIHVLFYLQEEEIEHLLNVIKSKKILIVHPYVNESISCLFEKYLGIRTSMKKVQIKEKILGKAKETSVCQSHFNLPLSVNKEEMAFLISHQLLYDSKFNPSEILIAASQYVDKFHSGWQKSGHYQIPQYQLMEIYE